MIGAVIAFAIGIGIAAINYALGRWCIKAKPERFALMQPVRSFVQIGYLLLLLLLGKYTPWSTTWLLVGGALGTTLPMVLFTYQLVKLNDSNGKEDQNG